MAQLDTKIHAVQRRRQTEGKFGHKQRDTGKLNQDIRMLHQDKRNLLKKQKILKKKIKKLS
jgi:hypothetical protein